MHRTIQLLMVSFFAASTFSAFAQKTSTETSQREKLSAAERWIARHPDKALIALIVLSLLVLGYLFYKFVFIPAVGKPQPDEVEEDREFNKEEKKYRKTTTGSSLSDEELNDLKKQKADLASSKGASKADDGTEPTYSIQNTESQSQHAPPKQTSTNEPVAATQKNAIVKEEFFMTVPNSNGTFSIQARKNNPLDCLYKFEVISDQSNRASFTFFGGESAMRKAQAFREEQLLPAVEFLNQPNLNTFKIAHQVPGVAVLDGNVWRIEKKIKIEFQP